MALLPDSLRRRLVTLASICLETLDDDQSVYKRILDQLEDVQRLHQDVIRTAESGISGDPKTFESKQKEHLECIQNDTFNSIKSLSNTFEYIICAECRQNNITFTKPCISTHINEIEHQTRADSLVITHHVQNAIRECIMTNNNINKIFKNYDQVKRVKHLRGSVHESHVKNMIEQSERQKQHYSDIVNELKNRILSTEEEKLASFVMYAQIASNVMNFQMKYDCIQKVCGTSSNVYTKVSDYEEFCQKTSKYLDLKIEDCESELSKEKEKRNSILSEWNNFQTQSSEIIDSLSENTNKCIEMNETLDILIQVKTIQLQGLNNDISTIKQSTQELNKKNATDEIILQELTNTLMALEKSRYAYRSLTNEQETHKRKLLSSIKDLDENIEKLTNKMTTEFNKNFIENYISNLVVNEFYSVQSIKLQIPNNLFDEMTKKISELEIERNELQCLADKRVEILKREKREKEKSQMNILSLGVDEKRKILDLSNKTIENGEVKISDCKDLFAEAVLVKNMLDNCTQVLLDCSRSVMIENYGKPLVKLIEEEHEVSSANLCLNDELRNLSNTDSGLNMEALLEERIQLLQDRMKAITAQREQIEQANRGLEEELNKLSNNFVKITDKVKVTDETEEEKTN